MSFNTRTARRSPARNTTYGRGPRPARSFGGGRTKRRGPAKDYIHPSRFIKVATPTEEVAYQATHTFNDFAVNELIKANISTKGFTVPSPIQDQAIPVALSGQDVIGIANTGTGKTIAFAVPVLNQLILNPAAKALIVAPTRELAQQIEAECKMIGKNSGLYGALLIGGAPMGPQLGDLRADPQIVIGTPGRIMDHMQRGSLTLSGFDLIVLDEVDRMLDMGFINDVRIILGELAANRQSFFFSATMDGKVSELIQTFSNDPVTISVKTGNTSDNVHQDIICFETASDKIEQLHDILNKESVTKTIVFDDTQRAVERLSNELLARGFKADAIHGGKTQGQRTRALNRFKKGEVTILVATDVAARGIDVADVSHVINYSTPQSYEDYVHRIGRAGRAGRVGYALTFVTDRY
ncbi:MAG TPA: DEAD/DEAH box helicase [Candidatus Saccharimonadales bacterium]|nr:DEAD/DEAH box helicase [Candidatus Saccharimonadales bacterium]